MLSTKYVCLQKYIQLPHIIFAEINQGRKIFKEGNYYFLGVLSAESIQGRKVLKGGNYSRKYGNLKLRSMKKYDRRNFFILRSHCKAHLTKNIQRVINLNSMEFSIYQFMIQLLILETYRLKLRTLKSQIEEHVRLIAIFYVINQKFHSARLLIYLVNKQAGWHFLPSLLIYSGLLFY